MEKDFRFVFRGIKYSFESFCNANPILTEEDAEMVINAALANGTAVEESNAFEKKTAKIIHDSDDVTNAQNQREEDTFTAEQERNIRNKDSLKHERVSFEFSCIGNARKFYNSAKEAVAFPNDDIMIDGLTNTVIIRNITDAELKALSVLYNTQRVVRSATVTTDKTIRAATNIAGYVAKDIAAPLIKTGIKGLSSAAGSLFHTAIKVGSDLVSTSVDSAKKTAEDIKTDESFVKAKGDIKLASAKIANKIGNFGGTSGIHIG